MTPLVAESASEICSADDIVARQVDALNRNVKVEAQRSRLPSINAVMNPPGAIRRDAGSLSMSVGRIRVVAHSPYFPIGEYLTRCELKQPSNDGNRAPKSLYLVRFAGAGPEFAGNAVVGPTTSDYCVRQLKRKFGVTADIFTCALVLR